MEGADVANRGESGSNRVACVCNPGKCFASGRRHDHTCVAVTGFELTDDMSVAIDHSWQHELIRQICGAHAVRQTSGDGFDGDDALASQVDGLGG